MFRVTRKRADARRNGTGETGIGHACGIASVSAERASPQGLLAWNRGHRSVEVNRRVGDKLFDEDACLALAGFAPENDALRTGIALAIVIRTTDFDSIAPATRHFGTRPRDAFAAILSP